MANPYLAITIRFCPDAVNPLEIRIGCGEDTDDDDDNEPSYDLPPNHPDSISQ